MSIGDHLDELRTRMWRAIKGLVLCLVIGFILDGIGDAVGMKWIGIGKPMLKVITDPVESKVKEFYHKRTQKTDEKLKSDKLKTDTDDKLNKTTSLNAKIPMKTFTDTFEGLTPKDPNQEFIETKIQVREADVYVASSNGEYNSDSRQFLTGLGVMEAFMVYIKVSLLCGVVLACPWIFIQIWGFIAAGLYPHEKRLVNVYLPFSVMLFLGGCVLCQFLVLPQAVSAMLGFYDWIGVDPDLRLNEWLGFAIAMPLVFGLAFQTPIVMLFFNRIGMFTWENYLSKWRYAIFVIAVLSALLTPSTDVVSMLWLFVPTYGLYMVGVLICYLMPPPQNLFGPIDEEEVGV